MPRTPLSPLTTVEQSPDRTPFQTAAGATPGAFGADVARAVGGLSQVGQQVAQVAIDEKLRRDDREARELDVEFTRRKRALMYGGEEVDADPGFYELAGDSAVQAAPDFKRQIDELRGELSARASNQNVRDKFSRSASRRTETEFDAMNRFTLKEEKTARITAIEARINEAGQDAAATWNSDDVMNDSLAIAKMETVNLGEANGLRPEVIQSQVEQNQTLVVKEAFIAALSAPNDTGLGRAEEILNKYGDLVDGPVRAEMTKMLSNNNLLAETQAFVDELMLVQMNEEEMLATARQELSDKPKLREQVTKDIKKRWNEIDSARKEEKREVAAEAFNEIWSGGLLKNWAAENPEQFLLLAEDGFLINSLQRAENLVSQGLNFAPVSDGETFGKILQQPTEDLARTNLELHRADLTQGEVTSLQRAIDGARDSMDRASKNNSIYDDAKQFLRDFAPPELDWGQGDQSANNKRRQTVITNEMNAFVDGFTKRGTTPTQAELRAEARRLLTPLESHPFGVVRGLQGILPEFIVGADESFVGEVESLTPEEKAEFRVNIDNIPASEQDRAKAAFKARGIEATDDLIEQLFGAEVFNDVARQRRLMGLSN